MRQTVENKSPKRGGTRTLSRQPWRTVLETPWFILSAIPAAKPGQKPYYCFKIPDSVVVLAMTPKGEVILVRQFRPPRSEYTFELPAGYLNEGESPLKAATRELAEETGYTCDQFFYQGVMRIFSSRMDYTIHTCFGKGARPMTKARIEKGIKRILVPRQKFEEQIMNGTFDSAACIAQYFRAKGLAFYETESL